MEFVKRLKNNRKGFLASFYVDILAYFTFIMVMIVFYVVFTAGKPEVHAKIESKFGDLDANMILKNYLEYPVEVNLHYGLDTPVPDTRYMTMADFILLVSTKEGKRLQPLLREKTEEFLEFIFNDPPPTVAQFKAGYKPTRGRINFLSMNDAPLIDYPVTQEGLSRCPSCYKEFISYSVIIPNKITRTQPVKVKLEIEQYAAGGDCFKEMYNKYC